MHEMQGARRRAPIQGFALAVVSLVAAFTLVGCGTTGSAGALGSSEAGPESSVGGAPSTNAADGESVSTATDVGDRVNERSPGIDRSNVPVVSAVRVAAVTSAIRRDSESIGLGTVHRIRVESENSRSSFAVLDVIRNGAPQLLGATVVRANGAWRVTNVDVMRSAQDLR